MLSAKMASQGLLKIKLFWNKGHYVKIFVHDVTDKILSQDSNYILDVDILTFSVLPRMKILSILARNY